MSELLQRALRAEGLQPEIPPQGPEPTAAAMRMRRVRAERASVIDDPANNPTNVWRTVREQGGEGGDPSLSLEDHEIKEREREPRERSGNSSANVREDVRTGQGSRAAYVRRTDALTDELVAIAQMVPVKDVRSAWLKFTGYKSGQWVEDVAGAWQRWCVDEAKREATERNRTAERASKARTRATAMADAAYTPPPVTRRATDAEMLAELAVREADERKAKAAQ